MNPTLATACAEPAPKVDLLNYYAEDGVRQRIVEFLGGPSLDRATCEYITGDDANVSNRIPLTSTDLEECLSRGDEICRSLWDRRSLIAHLDVEYVNFDDPLEPYRNPGRAFALQEPVEDTLKSIWNDAGICPLHILSGRGHHYVWRIDVQSQTFDRLAHLGTCPPTLTEVNARAHAPHGMPVPARMASAFAGLGLVMEYVAHLVKESSSLRCQIPVELTAVECGACRKDREMISLDISSYGDPLHTRTVRVPFSVYHKPAQQLVWQSASVVEGLNPIVFVPLQEINVSEALQIRQDFRMAAEYARRVSTTIPIEEEGTAQLLSFYEVSELAVFHRWFYSRDQHQSKDWARTYDRTPTEVFPMCVRRMLESPNDLLLHPSSMRLVTRVLLALGWHPRHIAGLICSKFGQDHGWGRQWAECDPATRSDFYTRLFSGLFAVGRDDLIDFNCRSCQEARICPVSNCPHNLECFRQSALERRHHEQLADRPIHRLFLPAQHS